MCKLIEKEVLEIRKLYDLGYTQRKIADMFNVGNYAVFSIVNRKTWKHI